MAVSLGLRTVLLYKNTGLDMVIHVKANTLTPSLESIFSIWWIKNVFCLPVRLK